MDNGRERLCKNATCFVLTARRVVEEGRLECDGRRMCSHGRGMLGGRAGVNCRLSRISEIQESSITPLQGKERWTSRKFFPGAVFCEGPDLLLYSTL